MKPILLVISGISLLFFCAVLLLQFDDDIRPEAQAMYDKATQHHKSNAYVYFWGIQAALDEDPQQAGQKVFDSIKQAEVSVKESSIDDVLTFSDYPNEKRIQIHSYYKKLINEDSTSKVERLFLVKDFKAESLNEEELELLQRYKKFMRMNDFHTLSKPGITEPLPLYNVISKVNDLIMLTAINSAENKAINIIIDNISDLRHHLKQTDTLIGKLVLAFNISNNLDVLSVLINKYNYQLDQPIASLSIEERSLEKAFIREFAMGYSLFKSLDKSAKFLKVQVELLDVKTVMPSWYIRIIYKPNMTINASYPFFKQTVSNSKLSLKAFAKKMLTPQKITVETSRVRNMTGKILLDVNSPDYNQYIGRIFSLDAKITLFNKVVIKANGSTSIGEIYNPFYQEEKKTYLLNDKKKICFETPTKTKENEHCLDMKY